IHSSQQLPQFVPAPLTPTPKWKYDLIEAEPEMERERATQKALDKAYANMSYYKNSLMGMQSNVILQSMYGDKLFGQLTAQEERKSKKQGWSFS
ncbi:hypothetical protein PAXRUDRAFT_762762, partial [Paxillus rubicundulus Ve08.2h10]